MHCHGNRDCHDGRQQRRALHHLERSLFVVAMMSTATINDTSTGIGSGVIN
jgi:hypothetical protein